MADNYLEKRYEEVFGAGIKVKKSVKSLSLNSLLLKNRSHRVYDQEYLVSEDQLRTLVDTCTKIPSVRNSQVLRYKIVTAQQADKFAGLIKFGGHDSAVGIAPRAYIVVCSSVPASRLVYIDLGIAAQSILLKAVELGLRGICIGAFDRQKVASELSLEYEAMLLIGIGKSSELIQLTHVHAGDDLAYYEKDGVHFVPKLTLEDLLL